MFLVGCWSEEAVKGALFGEGGCHCVRFVYDVVAVSQCKCGTSKLVN